MTRLLLVLGSPGICFLAALGCRETKVGLGLEIKECFNFFLARRQDPCEKQTQEENERQATFLCGTLVSCPVWSRGERAEREQGREPLAGIAGGRGPGTRAAHLRPLL